MKYKEYIQSVTICIKRGKIVNSITYISIDYLWKEAKKLKTFVAFGDGTQIDGTVVGDVEDFLL